MCSCCILLQSVNNGSTNSYLFFLAEPTVEYRPNASDRSINTIEFRPAHQSPAPVTVPVRWRSVLKITPSPPPPPYSHTPPEHYVICWNFNWFNPAYAYVLLKSDVAKRFEDSLFFIHLQISLGPRNAISFSIKNSKGRNTSGHS